MTADGGHRHASLTAEHRALIARAETALADATAACEAARACREVTARSRHLSARHTTDVLNALDAASRDLHMLQARIDAAKQEALRPRRLKRE